MIKDDVYFFHQTPEELCKQLIKYIPLEEGDRVLEPFRGESNFYNNLPENIIKDWCEITEGRCYTSHDKPIDWVITNPPFRLETGTKRVNSFYFLLNYYLTRVNKGIAFLINNKCLSSLTPKRIRLMNEQGFYLNKIVVCNIKKWNGRYYWLIITKTKNDFYEGIEKSF